MTESLSVKAPGSPMLGATEPGFYVTWMTMDQAAPEMSIYASPLVKASDELFQEVIDALAGYYISAEYVETVEDEHMMFGKAILVKATLYKDLMTSIPDSSRLAERRLDHIDRIQTAMNGGEKQRGGYHPVPVPRAGLNN